MTPIRSLTLIAAVSLAFVACGGSPSPANPAASTPLSAAPAAWSDTLSHDQKLAFMKATFTPAVAPVFKGHNATLYADFGCKTCHGPESKPQPRDFLPHLTLTADGKGIMEFTTKPEVSKFMIDVEVAAAKSFGKPVFDVKTGQGFGCAGCHVIDKK